jgi:hypothetical protein
MRLKNKFVGTFLIATAFALPLATVGCGPEHHGYYNDPYYHDRHHWDNNEVVYYNQWTVETHHDRHREFRHLNKNEQKQYWDWRHHHDNH